MTEERKASIRLRQKLQKREQRGCMRKLAWLEKGGVAKKEKDPTKAFVVCENVQLRQQVKALSELVLELKAKEMSLRRKLQ